MSASHSPLRVEVQVRYMGQRSGPEAAAGRYFFAYTITIHNEGDRAAQLISRHWIITDGNQEVQEVEGLGVVGEQPRIVPGQSYCYTSGAGIATPVGCMEGSYRMADDDGLLFDVPIPRFSLAAPGALH